MTSRRAAMVTGIAAAGSLLAGCAADPTSAVLFRSQRHPELLERVIRYDKSDLVEYSPVTSKQVREGMTVRARCRAAMEIGDKAGSGLAGEVNDGAVAWPPGRKPLIIIVFTRPAERDNDTGYSIVAAAAKIAARAVGP